MGVEAGSNFRFARHNRQFEAEKDLERKGNPRDAGSLFGRGGVFGAAYQVPLCRFLPSR